MRLLPKLFSVVVISLAGSSLLFAEKKETGHCEKKDGSKMVDLEEAKDKKACKQMGGRWNSKEKGHDDHGGGHKHGEGEKHKEGDNHDHDDEK